VGVLSITMLHCVSKSQRSALSLDLRKPSPTQR
jgi:hypothetical protein